MRFHGASGRSCTLLTPMSRKIGIPSDSMNRSYGVFGRPNLPKPARLPAVGSCQWLPGTSCMGDTPSIFVDVVARVERKRNPGAAVPHFAALNAGYGGAVYSFGSSPL